MSFDIYSGAPKMTIQDLFKRERPSTIQDAQHSARRWFNDNWLVETMVGLRTMFFNFGLRVQPVDKQDADELKKWLDTPEDGKAPREALYQHIEDVWNEWNIMDNVVTFWMEDMLPWTLNPEQCLYTNTFGNERLTVRLNLDKQELVGAQMLDRSQIERYTGGREIKLNNKNPAEQFRVLTRAKRYHGFCNPRLKRTFMVLGQMESMEAGEHAYAYGGRLVIRMTKLGFEVRNAAAAMKQADYMWNQKRHEAVMKGFRGHQGLMDATSNFDQKTEYVWTDPKLYDARKWETIINRMIWWAGPIGFMILAKQTPPHLFEFMKAEAVANRCKVGAHLENSLNLCGALPCPVKLTWSNKCFRDPRLAWTMAQGLLDAGPLSPQAALAEAEFDPEEEVANKREAAKKPEDYTPLFDKNHGNRPGEEGRPPGAKEGEAK